MALQDFSTDCTLMTRRAVSAPGGGTVSVWLEDSKFVAAIATVNSLETVLANRSEGKEVYSIYVPRGTQLPLDTYFRNEETGRYMRVTSLSTEVPKISTLRVKEYFGEYVDLLPK